MSPNVVSLFPAMPAFRRPDPCGPSGPSGRDHGHIETARLCRLAGAIAAAAFDVPPEEMSAATRRKADVAAARHVAIYLAHIVFQLPLQCVADGFRRDRTSVGHALRRIEDRRDDAAFDVRIEKLERIAQAFGPQERAGG